MASTMPVTMLKIYHHAMRVLNLLFEAVMVAVVMMEVMEAAAMEAVVVMEVAVVVVIDRHCSPDRSLRARHILVSFSHIDNAQASWHTSRSEFRFLCLMNCLVGDRFSAAYDLPTIT